MTSQTAGSAEGHPLIRTPDQRVRVFVSSTLKELAAAASDPSTFPPLNLGIWAPIAVGDEWDPGWPNRVVSGRSTRGRPLLR
jgi:hypothetical protein